MIRLERLRALKDDWDNDRAVAPTEKAIRLAELILNTQPAAVPLTNGGVQIEWHFDGSSPGVDVEIVITPEGTLELE